MILFRNEKVVGSSPTRGSQYNYWEPAN